MDECWQYICSEEQNQVRYIRVFGGYLFQVQITRPPLLPASTKGPFWTNPVFVPG